MRFKCTGCGHCCSGAPGYVWVSEEEIVAIAESLRMKPEEFVRRFVRLVGDRLSLIEVAKEGQYNCVFLEGNRCRIYEKRPRQCRTFPWWSQNLESQKAWEAAARECEGINHSEAPIISLEEIQKNLSPSQE